MSRPWTQSAPNSWRATVTRGGEGPVAWGRAARWAEAPEALSSALRGVATRRPPRGPWATPSSAPTVGGRCAARYASRAQASRRTCVEEPRHVLLMATGDPIRRADRRRALRGSLCLACAGVASDVRGGTTTRPPHGHGRPHPTRRSSAGVARLAMPRVRRRRVGRAWRNHDTSSSWRWETPSNAPTVGGGRSARHGSRAQASRRTCVEEPRHVLLEGFGRPIRPAFPGQELGPSLTT